MSGTSSRRPALLWGGAGLLIAVAIVVAFATQGSGGGGGGPLNAIAEAAEVTQQEPGGHATVRVTVTTPDRPEPLTMTGGMSYDDEGDTDGVITTPKRATSSTGTNWSKTALRSRA